MADRYTKYRSERSLERSRRRKKNKRINIALLIIIIAAAAVFIFAAVNIIIILINYAKARSTYDSLADEVIWISDENDETSTDDNSEQQDSSIKFDFDLLKSKCEYAVGYIYQEDILSYPIVQYTDNSYYLTHLIDDTYSSNGTLFVDCDISNGLNAKNSIVYGHNMNDGSMFGRLKRYQDESYFEKYPEMHVFIGYEHYIYKVFSVYTADVESLTYQNSFPSDADFSDFLNYVKSQSLYDTGIDNYGVDAKMITLSTCTSNSASRYRFVVVLIRDRLVTD